MCRLGPIGLLHCPTSGAIDVGLTAPAPGLPLAFLQINVGNGGAHQSANPQTLNLAGELTGGREEGKKRGEILGLVIEENHVLDVRGKENTRVELSLARLVSCTKIQNLGMCN